MRILAGRSWLLLCLALAPIGTIGIIADGAGQPARAQADVDFDYHNVLGTYGQFAIHPRWGEVWIPAAMPADWAPYRYGHWIYTDEWGWYWVADEDFGWVVYHYGRWVFDTDMGWIWIPGTDWSPAWVSWRRGDEAVGWAPMPPDEVIDDYEAVPDYWVFIRPVDIFAPRIVTVVFPAPQIRIFINQTVVVNRTVLMVGGNNRTAANPGIPASFIAAKIGHPIQTAAIQPHVLRGTIGVTGAIVAGVGVGIAIHEQVKVQAAVIQPAASIPPPVKFQPGHTNFGPDAPGALKRASAAGFQPSEHTLNKPPQGNVAIQHPQGAPAGQQHPPGGPPQSNTQHQQGAIQPSPLGGTQQQQNQQRQGNIQPQGNVPPKGNAQPGNIEHHEQGNLEHHEQGNLEHHEDVHQPSPPNAPVPPTASKPAVPQVSKPAAPTPSKAAAEKKCEKVNGTEVCK
jgi:hypothetical protein